VNSLSFLFSLTSLSFLFSLIPSSASLHFPSFFSLIPSSASFHFPSFFSLISLSFLLHFPSFFSLIFSSFYFSNDCSIVLVKSEEIAIPLETALYQPKGDWAVDILGNFFLISTQIQKSHLPGLYARLSNGKTWSITVGENPLPNSNYFFSGPIILHDNTKLAYSFGDNQTFSSAYCIDIESGNIIWKVSFSASSYPTGGIGVSSDDSILYFSQFGNTVALSISNGNEIWKLNERKYGSFASLQYISQSNNMLLGMDSGDCCGGGRIVCISPRSGDVMWATNFLGLKGYEAYIGGYGATVDKNHNIYLGLSNYGIVTLSPHGDVLFNYQNRDSKMSVAYSFQPLLMNTKAGMLFVVLWAGDSIPGKVRSNFITSFQYVNGLTNNTDYPKYTTAFIIELLAMVGVLVLILVILLSYLRNGYECIRI
jgi:hypothetical protein